MTEPTFPFQGTSPELEGVADAQEGTGSRRALIALVAAGGVAVAALGGYFFVFSGGDDATPSASKPVQSAPRKVTPAPTATPAPVKAPRISQKSFGQDPFKALVVDRPAAAAPVAAAAGGGTSAGGISTGGGTTSGLPGATTGGTTGGTTTTSGGTSPRALTVRVVSVASDNSSGRVTVGAKSYSVAVGDVFGTYFKTLRLKNGRCGSFTYGDERFDLCEGETARMQ
jgi:hypothetical protein